MSRNLLPSMAVVATVFSLLAAVPESASAAINLDLGVVGNVGYQLGTTNNDKINPAPMQVNSDEMFSFSDWFFAQKGFDPGNPIPIDVGLDVNQTSSGDNTAGTWMINDVWDTYGDVMIVLKGGNNSDPGVYVGYLLEQGATSGTYNTPFTHSATDLRLKSISHISVYVRAIPEPASSVVTALAFGICAIGRRNRRRSRTTV